MSLESISLLIVTLPHYVLASSSARLSLLAAPHLQKSQSVWGNHLEFCPESPGHTQASNSLQVLDSSCSASIGNGLLQTTAGSGPRGSKV